jgi:hypothetical protein
MIALLLTGWHVTQHERAKEMIMKTRLQFTASFVLTLFILTACASTQLTHTWVDRERQGKPVSSVMVIAVTKEEGIRRSFEDKFVEKLNDIGIDALSSADDIEIPADKKLEKTHIANALEQHKNDAVIVTQLKSVEKKQTYVPPRRSVGGYYGYYGHAYHTVIEPGYYRDDTYILLETNLYDVATEKLIWSGTSKTWNPSSTNSLIDGVVSSIIKEMEKMQLLK